MYYFEVTSRKNKISDTVKNKKTRTNIKPTSQEKNLFINMDGLNFMSNMTCIFDQIFQEKQLKLLRKQLTKQDTNNVFATILCERIKEAFGLRSLPPLSEVLPIIHFDQSANTHFTLIYTSSSLNPFTHICGHFFGHEMIQLQREVYHLIYSNTLNESDVEDVNVDDEEEDGEEEEHDLPSDSQIDDEQDVPPSPSESGDDDIVEDNEVREGSNSTNHYKIEYSKPEVNMVLRKISLQNSTSITSESQNEKVTDANKQLNRESTTKSSSTTTKTFQSNNVEDDKIKDKVHHLNHGNGEEPSASASPASLSEESKLLDLIKKSAPMQCEEANELVNNCNNSIGPFIGSNLTQKLAPSIIQMYMNQNSMAEGLKSISGTPFESLYFQKRGPGRPRKHPGSIDKKYTCERCFKSFNVRSHLESHMVTHTGEKKYTCKYCGNKFTQSSSLRNHVIAIHTHNFPHVCNYCRKGFLLPSQLKKHKMSVHQDKNNKTFRP